MPTHILNTSIDRLVAIGYLNKVEDRNPAEERDHAYRPGCPPENITLASFKQSIESFGNDEGADIVSSRDPAIRKYVDEVLSLKNCPDANLTLNHLIEQNQ